MGASRQMESKTTESGSVKTATAPTTAPGMSDCWDAMLGKILEISLGEADKGEDEEEQGHDKAVLH